MLISWNGFKTPERVMTLSGITWCKQQDWAWHSMLLATALAIREALCSATPPFLYSYHLPQLSCYFPSWGVSNLPLNSQSST